MRCLSVEGRGADMTADRVVRQLELVALADQDTERALAVSGCRGRRREAASQEGQGGRELLVMSSIADGRRDQVGLDAQFREAPLDPLGAPAVEPPPVLREALGEASVV